MDRVLIGSNDIKFKSAFRNLKSAILLGALLLALGFSAEAQQPAKIPRIGYVSGTGDASNQGPYVDALRQGLRDLGYIEGKNLVIDYRGAEGKLDLIPSWCIPAAAAIFPW